MAIKNLDKLSAHLGVDKDKFIEMIQSEESHEISIPEGQTGKFDPGAFAEDEAFNTWKSNFKRENENAAREIYVKEAKRELGYDFEGKDINKLLEAHAQKVLEDAKIEPEKKVKTLQEDVNALRQQLSQKDETINSLETDFEKTKFQFSVNEKLSGIERNVAGERLIPDEDARAIFNTKYGIDKTEDGFVVINKSTGDVMKDDLKNPMSIDKVYQDHISQYVKKPEGRGEGDQGGSKQNTLEHFNKRMQSEGVKVGSSEYNKAMNQEIQSGSLDLDSE